MRRGKKREEEGDKEGGRKERKEGDGRESEGRRGKGRRPASEGGEDLHAYINSM